MSYTNEIGLNHSDHFSHLKAAWHTDRIDVLRRGEDATPTHIILVLSDLCNQNCHFCGFRMEGGFNTANFAGEDGNPNPARFMPYEKAIEILNDCAALGVTSVEFTGGGEPTVHPRWSEIIEHAQKLGLETGLVTNGTRLTDCWAIRQLTWMRISLDAAEPDTYERMRESRAWSTVLKNLVFAGQLEKPTVGLGFVVTRENYTELAKACELAHFVKMDYVRISAMFSAKEDSYYDGIREEIDRQRAEAAKLNSDEFEVVDLFTLRIEDLKQAAPDYSFCGYQQFVLYIGGDQKVYTCCENAYTDHGEIGDLKEQSFKEWIVSHRRFDFDARSCHHCPWNNKNRVINYLLSKPQHVGFV